MYNYEPINAPNATNEPIHANSSSSGLWSNGESLKLSSFNFGNTGDVQPSVVPTATLDKFAV